MTLKAIISISAVTLIQTTFVIAQVVDDLSPSLGNSQITNGDGYQSVSGKALSIAVSADGQRLYLGGHSGVWRSDDGGANWKHMERPYLPNGTVDITKALLCPNVYDLLVSASNKNVVLAATGRDNHSPSKNGIYRSADGGETWTLVHQFVNNGSVGRIVAAPDNAQIVYAAGQYSVSSSTNGGVNWITSWRRDDFPGLGNGTINNIIVGHLSGTYRRLYAAGNGIGYLRRDGTWLKDQVAANLGLKVDFATDGLGTGSKAISIDPANDNIIYLAQFVGQANIEMWKGDFSAIQNGGNAVWTKLPVISSDFPGFTASGGAFIVAHRDLAGKLYLFASDCRTVHLSIGVPDSPDDWKRIDRPNVKTDPHSLDLTKDFRVPQSGTGGFGRIAMTSDGGAYYSSDGLVHWKHGDHLYTLGPVNMTVMRVPGKAPAVCIGTGDNSGFFTSNGGLSWKPQDYVGGDNDVCFSDPLQGNRLIVFSPRDDHEKGIYLYKASEGNTPDGAKGTSQRTAIFKPAAIPKLPGETSAPRQWNAVSSFFHWGYRALVYTLADQKPRPDGDFIVIKYTRTTAKVLRTTAMSKINAQSDWETTATTEGPNVKVFRQGPDLPDKATDVVQASGGHESPVFYAATIQGSKILWKWTRGMSAWRQLTGVTGAPSAVQRFFVDPYRPNIVYVLGNDAIWRSDNGGTSWEKDENLQTAMTDNGAYPVSGFNDGPNPGEALLRDMLFDPYHPAYRFAIGPAGVFYSIDGRTWKPLALSSANPMHPNNGSYDPCERTLYVATGNRGMLRFSFLPPESKGLIGDMLAARGRITLLRVHDVNTKYGPASDQLNVEVVIKLEGREDDAFGFQLRNDGDRNARKGMLELLRLAFKKNKEVRIDYRRRGCSTGEIIRVWFD